MLAHYNKLLTKYHEWLNNHPYTYNTKNNYAKTAGRFLAYLSDFNIINLKDADIERILSFLTKRGTIKYAKAYFNLRLSSLGLFYAWLYTNKYCALNPIIEYKKAKLHPKLLPQKKATTVIVPVILTPQEQQSLLNLKTNDTFIITRNKCMIALILAAALYADEVIHLSPQDLNLEKGTISINKDNQPNRVISIDSKLQKVCREWLANRSTLLRGQSSPWLFITNKAKPIAKRVLYRIIANCMQDVGIDKPHLGPEVLRQTAIVGMLQSGLSLEAVQVITGIKTLKNIQRYQDR